MHNVKMLARPGGARTTVWMLKQCRQSYGLTILQASHALGVSPSTYERMEQGVLCPPTKEWTETQFSIFIDSNDVSSLRNLIFGTFPLKMAREILEIPCAEMANEFGYKESTWKRFETNGRKLDDETVRNIEDLVRNKLKSTCEF